VDDEAVDPDYAYGGTESFMMGTDDVTLYAVWEAEETYSVTYDANGATSGMAPTNGTTYISGDEVTVLGNPGGLDKTGYVFLGWATDEGAAVPEYIEGGTFAITSDVTLYAVWGDDPLTYSVTYDANDGSGEVPETAYYSSGFEVTVLFTRLRRMKDSHSWVGTTVQLHTCPAAQRLSKCRAMM
jgi:uncharacterized repeat protein (TIGR02543 family)